MYVVQVISGIKNWRWFWHWIKSPSSQKFVLVATYDLQCFKSKQSFFKKPSRYHLEITIFTKNWLLLPNFDQNRNNFSMDCLYLGLCTRLRLWKIHVQGLFPGSVSVFHTPPFSSLSELHHPILDQENQCRLLLLR